MLLKTASGNMALVVWLLLIVLAMLLLIGTEQGCSGVEEIEGDPEIAVEGDLSTAIGASVDLGIAQIELKAGAIITDTEAVVDLGLNIRFMRNLATLKASISWDIRAGTLSLCGSIFMFQGCTEVAL